MGFVSQGSICQLAIAALASMLCCVDAEAQSQDRTSGNPPTIVHADVVALDQLLVYNRFGSFNPFGMIFALKRDVQRAVPTPENRPSAEICSQSDGTEAGTGVLEPGHVMLKRCKRPRPLVLRGNVGDVLQVTLTNLLRNDQPDFSASPEEEKAGERKSSPYPPRKFCAETPSGKPAAPTRPDVREAATASCAEARQQEAAALADKDEVKRREKDGHGDWPRTRRLSLAIPGLEPLPAPNRRRENGPIAMFVHGACLGTDAIKPGESVNCRWRLDKEGTHLFSSLAAPSGGEGDAGSLGHGLFGALIVEPAGSAHYRSQVTEAAFNAAWNKKEEKPTAFPRHARKDKLDFAAYNNSASSEDHRPLPQSFAHDFRCTQSRGIPILALSRECRETHNIVIDGVTIPHRMVQVVHSDLNAIIVPAGPRIPIDAELAETDEDKRTELRLKREASIPFREFTVIFHDELKTFYADQFRDLEQFGQLSGIRDGFAINYGSSGVGSMVIANRKRIGPAANCPECMYEEFFLESAANGDPALLEVFPDDPSNVHHSYLNDKVVFRNFHAGKETHVFHLHAHQWFAGNDANRGSYLDSQTIGPQQGLTYKIYHGGLDRHAPPKPASVADQTKWTAANGWWESLGSGNRNRTVGDSIFHCHLYPHFAQGMWELWRVHDVLEDGTRRLSDGQENAELSTAPRAPGDTKVRSGSVDADGNWLGKDAPGTPIPGLIPLPDQGLPLLPTYANSAPSKDEPQDYRAGMPGYPFYIAGKPGHRAPQPPLDMAQDDGQWRHGGLRRHVVEGGVAKPSVAKKLGPVSADKLVATMLALGDMTSEFENLDIATLPHAGTFLEQAAMRFHHNGADLKLRDALGAETKQVGGSYQTPIVSRSGAITGGQDGHFAVNGSPPAPGAPYADPCGAPAELSGTAYRRYNGKATMEAGTLASHGNLLADPGLIGTRRYDASIVQMDMVVNRAGWHDPQARINVLTHKADEWKESKRSDAEPFFFRAFSGECIEFRHTNETPKDLELDDFQLKVPTDTVGQHIHLVKFDVTSADGSGNGWNYEDGTFAPDEILARICASSLRPSRQKECDDLAAAKSAIKDALSGKGDLAAARTRLRKAELWRLTGAAHRKEYFQTTIQRWFADPILSNDGERGIADRTLRTVFTHDHFAPSNIQQHGFYNALLVEPSKQKVCLMSRPEMPDEHADKINAPQLVDGKLETSDQVKKRLEASCVMPSAATAQNASVLLAGPFNGGEQHKLVGTRAAIASIHEAGTALAEKYKVGEDVRERVYYQPGIGDPIHPDAREYAIAIADFATLYDGHVKDATLDKVEKPSADGIDRLVREGSCKTAPADADENPAEFEWPLRVPAVAAGGCHKTEKGIINPVFSAAQEKVIGNGVKEVRLIGEEIRHEHGRPVAPPVRPEAISQKHHDPYLVNYRLEALPLRVGSTDRAKEEALPFSTNPCYIEAKNVSSDPKHPIYKEVRSKTINHNDIKYERTGEGGDLARSRLTRLHGDPCTPIIEAYDNERIQVRMIQGAQEVQHTFVVEQLPNRRFVDGSFPTARPVATSAQRSSRQQTCIYHPVAKNTRPRQQSIWASGYAAADPGFILNQNRLVAGCDNIRNIVTAQEIGISEHFEIGSNLSSKSTIVQPRAIQKSVGLQSTLGARAPARADEPRPAAELGASGRSLPLDYEYSFGSLDAIWNGAWGIVRLHDWPAQRTTGSSEGAFDISRCLAASTNDAAARSRCLDRASQPGNDNAVQPRAELLVEQRLGKPFGFKSPSDSAPSAPDEMTCQGPGRPQAERTVAAVQAREIFGGTEVAYDPGDRIYDSDALVLVDVPATVMTNVSRGAFIAALAKHYRDGGQRPRPYELRINAGDCLRLTLVNALPLVLRDKVGDALMPNIVPLNVDQSKQRHERHDVRPSSSVALSMPISRMAPARKPDDGAAPVGVNGYVKGAGGDAKVLVDAAPDEAPMQMRTTEYYAGFVRITSTVATGYELIPYAFGTLPIRPIGDNISHGPHGLVGTLIVEPQGAVAAVAPIPNGGHVVHMPMVQFTAEPGVTTKPAGIPGTVVREHVLVWQDGLNLWTKSWKGRKLSHHYPGQTAPKGHHPLPDCPVCDDSYDLGEKGVSYGTAPFNRRMVRLGAAGSANAGLGLRHYLDEKANLNGFEFPAKFFGRHPSVPIATPTLAMQANEEVVIRVSHPSGRARQRSFVLYGAGYDDLVPGFGSMHSALLAPGKSLSAHICASRVPGTYLWRDGPQPIFAGGVWGHVVVNAAAEGAASLCQ
ncbi:MAG: hypothetical protein AB7F78_12280 [Hyphomicrobiaceae bacterium]